MEISVEELRGGLSRHLAGVRDGRTVTITEHGRPIARIVPVGMPSRLERLRSEGRVTPAERAKTPGPEPVEIVGTVSDLVDDQRR